MEDVIITFQPTDKQRIEIKDWLYVEEQKERLAGLYVNWNSVEFSVGRNECAVILLGEKQLVF